MLLAICKPESNAILQQKRMFGNDASADKKRAKLWREDESQARAWLGGETSFWSMGFVGPEVRFLQLSFSSMKLIP